MENSSLSKEWLEYAAMDLKSAEFLLAMRPVPIEIICYHCEQAAEKLLKSVLVYYGQEPPKTHDLVRLCTQCSDLAPEFESLLGACAELTPYGVQARYPSGMELEERDREHALAACHRMAKFVLPKLDLTLDSQMGQMTGLE